MKLLQRPTLYSSAHWNVILHMAMPVAGLLVVLLCWLFGAVGAAGQSTTPRDSANEYQVVQRARSLLSMALEIDTLPDVEMRSYLRAKILAHVYASNLPQQELVPAETMLTAFFEDIAKHRRENASRTPSFHNEVLSALRRSSPALANKVADKYLSESDTVGSELMLLNAFKSGYVEIADRVIAKIKKGVVSFSYTAVYYELNKVDPRSGQRVLDALLTASEANHVIFMQAVSIERNLAGYTGPQASKDLRAEYLKRVLAAARKKAADPEMELNLNVVISALETALPRIKEFSPEMHDEAKRLSHALNAQAEPDERSRKEAHARIAESPDKIKQTLAEVSAATDMKVKRTLWQHASILSVREKKYRDAAKVIMNVEPNLGVESRPTARDQYLWLNVLRAALREKDLESAEYVILQIQDDVVRGGAMIDAARAYVQEKRFLRASEYLSAGLDLMEKGVPSRPEQFLYASSAIYTSFQIDHTKTFEVASRLINIANRIPPPGSEARPSTAERKEYVEKVLIPIAFSMQNVFVPLSSSNAELASTRAEEITRKEWNLAARLFIERSRRHVPQK